MRAILTNDGSIKIILSSTVTGHLHKDQFLSKDVDAATVAVESNNTKPIVEATIKNYDVDEESDDDDDERYSEYKMSPRQIFCASICQVS